MRLRNLSDVYFSGHGQIFRQSRIGTLLRALVLGGAFAGAGPLWYSLDAPWFVSAMCLLTAIPIVGFLIGDVCSAFRRSNWLLSLDGDEVRLNMRSYSHHGFTDGDTIIATSCSEIEEVGLERTKYVGPMGVSNGDVEMRTSTVLRLVFHQPIPDEILEAIRAERGRVSRRTYFGGLTVSSRSHNDPVSIDGDRTLLLLWTCQSSFVRPSPKKAVSHFANCGVTVREPVQRDWKWSSLSESEQDEMLDQLRARGRVVEAKRLIDRRRSATGHPATGHPAAV